MDQGRAGIQHGQGQPTGIPTATMPRHLPGSQLHTRTCNGHTRPWAGLVGGPPRPQRPKAPLCVGPHSCQHKVTPPHRTGANHKGCSRNSSKSSLRMRAQLRRPHHSPRKAEPPGLAGSGPLASKVSCARWGVGVLLVIQSVPTLTVPAPTKRPLTTVPSAVQTPDLVHSLRGP